MDIQRIILIGALCLISYMMVLQWNEDYGQAPKTQQPVTSVSAYGNSSSKTELPSTYAKPQQHSDIPNTAPKEVEVDHSTLIKVKTDVLDVTIDTKGGDIIQVALPKYKASQGSNLPFVLLEQTPQVTYISQSGLVGKNGADANPKGRPAYTTDKSAYSLGDKDKLNIDLKFTDLTNAAEITKRYSFTKGSYEIELSFIVSRPTNLSGASNNWTANLFGQIKRDNSGDPTSTGMGMQSYLGPVFSTKETKYEKYSFDDIDEQAFNRTSLDGWVAMSQHYFLSAWIPQPGAEYIYKSRKINNNYIVGFLSPEFSVASGETKTVQATFYAGPKDQDMMEKAQEDLKLTVDYSWLWWVASPLYMLLKWIHSLVGNWGLSIICITILVKAALFQLNAKAFRSMAKMRKFGPEMQRLKELYGDDRQRMSQEMMKLYKKEKINPLGGCLPIVAQMPIFISLYWVLMESVELRHADFLYITDLAAKDPYFILPILMGLSMFIQQSLNPAPPDPMQAKIMKMLPIMFTFFFLWFPAGLTLYWVVNNILSIIQQYIINKQIERGTTS